MKRIMKSLIVIGILLVLVAKVTWTVFTAQSQIVGAQFATGKAQLFLLRNVAGSTATENLTHSLPGTNFDNIVPGWSATQLLKLFNAGTIPLRISFSSEQLSTAQDLYGFAQYVSVRVSDWNDINQNGVVDNGEVGNVLSDWQPLSLWVHQPIVLGNLAASELKGLVVSFKVDDLDQNIQGSNILFNFNFDAIAPEGGAH